VRGECLGLPIETGIIQQSKVSHTSSGGLERLARQLDLTGSVQAGKNYLIVDDALTQGSTFTQLKKHIKLGGAPAHQDASIYALLARQMHSISWEVVHVLFTAAFKSQQKNVDAIQVTWENHPKGRASLDNIRQLIFDAAGRIERPAWDGRDSGLPAERRAGDARVVPGVQLSGRGARPDAGRAGGEPAPAAAAERSTDDIVRSNPRGTGGNGESQTLDSRPEPSLRGPSLQGLPAEITVDGQRIIFVGFKPAQEAAAAYAKSAGLDYRPPTAYAKVDAVRAKRIADAFEAMPHDPQDPTVKAAYQALIDETTAQHAAMLATGRIKPRFLVDGCDDGCNVKAIKKPK
jgi:hypothetical protein